MQRTEPEPAAPDGTRQATLHPGMASLTAAADRAPSARHARKPQTSVRVDLPRHSDAADQAPGTRPECRKASTEESCPEH
ncbi:DUF6380 family protein [Streptomyces rubradiris]|uniref:DUF6380 family protein n=1 Tax=Streptomyces rubradiris TaxID=285531 RepID=UPI0033ECD73C